MAGRVPSKEFARRGQGELVVGGHPKVSPWAVPPSQKPHTWWGAGCFVGAPGAAWAPQPSGRSLLPLDGTSWFSRGVCVPTGEMLSTARGKVSRVQPVLRDTRGAGWGAIVLWVPPPPLGLRTSLLDVLFFPLKNTGSSWAWMGLLGWRWVTAAMGLPSRNPVF